MKTVKRYLFSAFIIWLLMIVFCQDSEANDNSAEDSINKNEEISFTDSRNQTEATASSEEGPPDSHEAMNNRETIIGSGGNEKGRRKRSYEFLMGLVKRNSTLIKITQNGVEQQQQGLQPSDNVDLKASESLLELLVKIASNPEQWAKVHEMLQRLDKDLTSTKQIIEKINPSSLKAAEAKVEKSEVSSDHHQTNPWQLSTLKPYSSVKSVPSSYQKNFAYHRVTGNPLIHSNKSPKAYIAVSVIAPKTRTSEDDVTHADDDDDDATLENELKELKPWTHRQNLKNMADIRSKWIIQDDKKREK